MPVPAELPIQRHPGLDWLRIGAFGLLILFHLGLYFAPGHWIVKTPEPAGWVSYVLAAIVPWRLSVLFAVSGYATAAMLQRHPTMLSFARERSKRLLVPLVFGVIFIVPPQGWVRLEVAGVHTSLTDYLARYAFSFSGQAGAFLPTWEHLWFLPYLWVYTMLLMSALVLGRRWHAQADRAMAWLAAGRRLVWVPAAAIVAGMLAISFAHVPGAADSADYVPAFAFGFAYAHRAELRTAVLRQFGVAAVVSLLMLAALWSAQAIGPSLPLRPGELVSLVAGGTMSWTMALVALNCAERYLKRDHPWRRPLAAAVFPAYIVHQTAIVFAGWQLTRFGVVGWRALVVELAAVTAAMLAAYSLARDIPLMGTLLGMPRKPRSSPHLGASTISIWRPSMRG